MHLEAAKKMGDQLIVSITNDEHVNKGAGHPVFNENQRAQLVKALKCVDGVLIVPNLIEALEQIQPDILVKGIDYKKGLQAHHTEYCQRHGIEIKFTNSPKLSAFEIYESKRC